MHGEHTHEDWSEIRPKSNQEFVTMGMLDRVRKSAHKAKVTAEVALLDRQVVQLQSAMGVELYDRLSLQQQQQQHRLPLPGAVIALPSFWQNHASADATRGPLEECRRDIQVRTNEREACALELEKLAVNRERAPPAVTNQDVLKKAGSWVTDTGKEANLNLRIKWLEREIHQRKEKFGVEVFDLVTDAAAVEAKKKSSSMVSGAIGKLAGSGASREKEIQDCVTSWSRQVALIRQQKEAKLREIAAIDEGTL